MSPRPLVPALLTLGLASLISAPIVSMPIMAHAQTAQVSQKPKLTTLHRFDKTYGAESFSAPTLGTDGNFYGVTPRGGVTYNGVIYRMTPAGRFTTLHSFKGFDGIDGAVPYASPVEGKDGAFYGTAPYVGSKGYGTVYRITTSGQFKVIHAFTRTDGSLPLAGLLPAPDGGFYGMTLYNSGDIFGTVFHMTPDGTVTTLHTFSQIDGYSPASALIFGADGALYGVTQRGGTRGEGTAFRLTTSGTSYRVLHNFTLPDGIPGASLVLGPDGAFYGTAEQGSTPGTVYRLTAAGVFTTLHRFSNDRHGSEPNAPLTLGADGVFYSTLTSDGQTNAGAVFSMTPAGQVTTLYAFHTNYDGNIPYAGVVFGPGGLLYGTTAYGGAKNYGTIYSLSVPAAN